MIVVGIADAKIAKASDQLITYALGSCVGVCIHDPSTKIGGMVHIMLPRRPPNDVSGNLFKYADSGIVELLNMMQRAGGNRRRFICKIAGGAKMFDTKDNSMLSSIGQNNVEMVKRTLQNERLVILRQDVGDNYARTVTFDPVTGNATVRAHGRPDNIL